ncbi:hypothetical protein HAX54_028640, partial [Datura stramonium]|nr:hypothetical protein [Datura stramonium]
VHGSQSKIWMFELEKYKSGLMVAKDEPLNYSTNNSIDCGKSSTDVQIKSSKIEANDGCLPSSMDYKSEWRSVEC